MTESLAKLTKRTLETFWEAMNHVGWMLNLRQCRVHPACQGMSSGFHHPLSLAEKDHWEIKLPLDRELSCSNSLQPCTLLHDQ